MKGTLVPSNGRLDDIARGIHGDWQKGRAAYGDAVDCYFSIGHQLRAARKLLPKDSAFGAWFNAQDFGFKQTWAYTLRQAAEHEDAVRQVVNTQVLTGGSPNIKKAVAEVVPPTPKPAAVVEAAPDTPAPIKPAPPDPVRRDGDHDYDVDRFVADGLVCLPGCPHPDHEVESAPPDDLAWQTVYETDPSSSETVYTDLVSSVEVPAPPEDAAGSRPDPAATSRVVSVSTANTAEQNAAGLEAIVAMAHPEDAKWHVLVSGTDSAQFQQLCQVLITTDCRWECVGEVGNGRFAVEVQA